ncbi:MAG: histone deacetylase family protein [Betaproteobacteria bacterium]|nr:histone deacetylase family protein [Betaproteobacteria bacterium]
MLSAYVTHPSSLLHEMGPGHPECPARCSAIHDYLLSHSILDLMVPYTAPAATLAQVHRVHDALYVAELMASVPAEGYHHVDPDTAMNCHTLDAAWHAAGAAVLAAEIVARGEVASAFCNVRPPGHHATRHEAMGFCFFNNVAVGIAHALAECGVSRVALVDFDVHHGNGSEDIFANDERVLMVSTFQRGLYPLSGEEALGPNSCNVPLEPRSGRDALRDAVTRHWLPALEDFRPEMIFFSAGFDAHREDDMGRLGWVEADYTWITQQVMGVAARHSRGRIVSLLEGGYALSALARSVAAHVRVLMGAD